jgi:hypothetical protein
MSALAKADKRIAAERLGMTVFETQHAKENRRRLRKGE